jgi:hypothetical protein
VMRSFALTAEHVIPAFDNGTPSASELMREAQHRAAAADV